MDTVITEAFLPIEEEEIENAVLDDEVSAERETITADNVKRNFVSPSDFFRLARERNWISVFTESEFSWDAQYSSKAFPCLIYTFIRGDGQACLLHINPADIERELAHISEKAAQSSAVFVGGGEKTYVENGELHEAIGAIYLPPPNEAPIFNVALAVEGDSNEVKLYYSYESQPAHWTLKDYSDRRREDYVY